MRRKKYIIVFCTVLVLALSLTAGITAYKLAAKIETQVKALSAMEWVYPLQKVYDIEVRNDYFAIYSYEEIKITYIDRDGAEVDGKTVKQSQSSTKENHDYVNRQIQTDDGWKCGIVDENRNWLIEPIFHEIELVDDFAIVTLGERMGVMKLNG